jgi:predicted phosphohydrolase
VPCVAAVYYDDMYVERAFSEETAAAIRGVKLWVTNEYEHNALRADGERLLDRLLRMLHGEI